MIIGSKVGSPTGKVSSRFRMLRYASFCFCSFFLLFLYACCLYITIENNLLITIGRALFYFDICEIQVLTDIGSDVLPIVPSKPIGAPAAHSLITSPNYQLSPRANYANDVITSTNILSNGHHSPNVRETQNIQKTEVLHVDTNSEPTPYVFYIYSIQICIFKYVFF